MRTTIKLLFSALFMIIGITTNAQKIYTKCIDANSIGGDEQIRINWNQYPAFSEFGSYDIYWQKESPTKSENWKLFSSISSHTQDSLIVSQLSNDSTYYFRVDVIDTGAVKICRSNITNAVTAADSTVSAPTNLELFIFSNSILAEWDAVSDTTISKFRIYADSIPNPTKIVDSALGYNSDSKILLLDSNICYFIRITAVDVNGNESNYSNENWGVISNTTNSGPTNLSFSYNGTVKFTWDPISNFPEFLRYQIQRSTDSINYTPYYNGPITIANDTSLLVPGIPENSKQYFKVKALDKCGRGSELSNEVEILLIDTFPPETPTKLFGKVSDKQVTLRWNQIANQAGDFTHYRIYVDTILNPNIMVGTSYSVYDTSITITGLINGKTYFSNVTSNDGQGNESNRSNDAAFIPLDKKAPETPTDFKATIDSAKTKLTWIPTLNLDNDFEKYILFRGTSLNALVSIDTFTNVTRSQKTINSLNNGTLYYFGITAVDSLNNASDTIIAFVKPSKIEKEPNDNVLSATWIESNLVGNITSNIDKDYFKFRVNFQNTNITIKTNVVNNLDTIGVGKNIKNTNLTLYDTDGNSQLDFNVDDPSNANYSKITYNIVDTGVYYIRVQGNFTTNTGYYSLSLSKLEPDRFEPNDQLGNAKYIAEDTTTIDKLSIYPANDIDVFSFKTDQDATVELDYHINFYTGEIKFLNTSTTVLQSTSSNSARFIVPDTSTYFVSFEIPGGFTSNNYEFDFKIIPPISYSDSFQITEIYYKNPSVQFIELYNLHTDDIDVSQFELLEVGFKFPKGYKFNPREYIIIANDSATFDSLYGFYPDFSWGNQSISNSSQTISFLDSSGALIDNVTYQNGGAFPFLGSDEHTIETKGVSFNNNLGNSWKSSSLKFGTPGHVLGKDIIYLSDSLEENDTIGSSVLLDLPASISITLSEISDTSDIFKFKLAAFDTLIFNSSNQSKDLKLKYQILDKSLFTLSAGNNFKNIQFIPSLSDTYYLKLQTRNDSLQFIVNEGSIDIEFVHLEKPIESPWSESFNNTASLGLPIGLKALDLDGNNKTWRRESLLNGINGSHALEVNSNSNGNNDWLIFQPMKVKADDFFSFYTKSSSNLFKEKFEIWIGDREAIQPSDFHTLLDTVTLDTTGFKLFQYDLNRYISQTIRIAIRNVSINQNIQYIDNVSFSPPDFNAAIKGIVTDVSTGFPIEGVEVSYLTKSVLSDSLGNYILDELPYRTLPIKFYKKGYTSDIQNFKFSKDDTITFYPKLIETIPDTVYKNDFDTSNSQGYTVDWRGKGWKKKSSFTRNSITTIPISGDSMMVIGGANGYQVGEYSSWSLISNGITISNVSDIVLEFDYNSDADPDDNTYLVQNGNLIFDLNSDGSGDSLDFLPYSTIGWTHQSIPLTNLTPFSNLDMGFLFADDSVSNTGFGVALDNVELILYKEVGKAAPRELIAQSYVRDSVPLSWKIHPNSPDSFKVYKMDEFGLFQLFGITTDTIFYDTLIQNLEEYRYKVSAVYPYGESEFSNTSVAIAGVPSVQNFPFRENFNSIGKDTIPNGWNAYESLNQPWKVGDTTDAETFNAAYEASSDFIFCNFFTMNTVNEYYTSILGTPWFDCSNVTDRVVLKFKAQGFSFAEFHKLAYKDGLLSPWVMIDTISGHRNWKKYNYDITDLCKGKDFFQLGFVYENDSTNLIVNNVGWAIDDVRILELKRGFLKGHITSQAGGDFYNLPVTVNLAEENELNIHFENEFITDDNGKFRSINPFYYDSLGYVITADGWHHKSDTSSTKFLNGDSVIISNLSLDLELNSPRNLSIENNQNGFPVLNWQTPKLIGEQSYDNGIYHTSDTLFNGYSAAILIKADAPIPFKINQVAVYSKSDVSGTPIKLIGLGVNGVGQPNISDTIFERNTTINSNNLDWNFVNLNRWCDTSSFYLVIAGRSSSKDPLNIGYMKNLGSTNSLWNTTGSFVPKSDGLMMRLYIEAGGVNHFFNSNVFSGTYEVFRYDSSQVFNSLANSLTNESFMDSSLKIGDSVAYYVQAHSTYGASLPTNSKSFIMKGLPFIDVKTDYLTQRIPYSIITAMDTLKISNIGKDTLNYAVSYHFGITEFHKIDTPKIETNLFDGVSFYSNDTIVKGDTLEVHFFIENINFINENISEIVLDFHSNVKVVESTLLEVLGTNRYMLALNDSNRLRFIDPNANPTGEILPFEVAEFTARFWVDSTKNFTNNYRAEIIGDRGDKSDWADKLTTNPIALSITNQIGGVLAGSTSFIPMNINVLDKSLFGDKVPGYLEIKSNDNLNDSILIPFDVFLEAGLGKIVGVISDDVTGALLSGSDIVFSIYDTISNANGEYEFNEVPVGGYVINASKELYYPKEVPFSLKDDGDTVYLPISLVPDILNPIQLYADGNIDAIELNWQLEDHVIFDFFELPTGNSITDIENWRTEDLDKDNESWKYFGVGPHSGNFSVSVLNNTSGQNNDWIISQQLRVEESNAVMNFWAAPQDINFSEEEFKVWVSKSGNSPADFTDSLFYYRFQPAQTNWKNFNLSLKDYLGDSIFVAIQCVSRNQYMLKIDDIAFQSVQNASEAIDSMNYSFYVFRNKNFGSFSIIDTIKAINDTISYLDYNVQEDSLYTYYVKHFYPNERIESYASNFATFRLLSKDIGVSQIDSPATGRDLGFENVHIQISNLGTDTILTSDSITLSYQVNSGVITSELFMVDSFLAPQQSIAYTFQDSSDFSAKGKYEIAAWSRLSEDQNFFNDTLKRQIQHKNDTILPPDWDLDPFNFQFSMSLTAEVFIVDTLSTDTNDLVAAYVGNQIRGVANVEYVNAFGVYVIQMAVYSNLAIENINFKVWDASKDSIMPIVETYTFINNQVYGTLTNPDQVHTPTSSNYYDLELSTIISPVDGENLYSNNEIMEVQIKNVGPLSIVSGDSISINYSIQKIGSTTSIINEAIMLTSSFNQGDSSVYTFSANADLSDTGIYVVTAWVSYPSDLYNSNDTIVSTIHHVSPSINDPDWEVDPNNFQYSAFITAKVLFNDVLSSDTGDVVAAMVNGKVRGVANIEHVQSFDVDVIQIPIYSNSSSGETIRFQAYDKSIDEVMWVEESFTFLNNSTFGNLASPERLHATSGYKPAVHELPAYISKIYPNPVKDALYVDFKKNISVHLKLINSLGQEVFAKFLLNESKTTIDISGFPAGVYSLYFEKESGFNIYKLTIYE